MLGPLVAEIKYLTIFSELAIRESSEVGKWAYLT